MRKLAITASTLVPAMLFAGTLAAQTPLPQEQQRGPAASEAPKSLGEGSGKTEPGAAGNAQRAPDASGGERAQGNEQPMPRQKSGAAPSKEMEQRQGKEGTAPSKEMQQQGKTEDATPSKKKTQDAQRQNESSPNGAQRKPDTSSAQETQRSKTETEQRSGSKQGSDVETTGSVGITAEKRTTIRETITRERVTPIRDVNFSVNVGIEVPRTIELRPLPARVIEIVPQYRRYRYFILADGRIVIVEPASYKIVYIITA